MTGPSNSEPDLSLRNTPALQKALETVADRLGVSTSEPDVVMWAKLGLMLFEETPECKSALGHKRNRGRPRETFKRYEAYTVTARLASLETTAIARETGRSTHDCSNEVAALLVGAGRVSGRSRDFATLIRRAAAAKDRERLAKIIASIFP